MKPAALTVPGLLTGGYPERDFAGQTRGESRSNTLRIMFVPPLGVDFDVQEDDRIVYVLTVWHFGKNKPSP